MKNLFIDTNIWLSLYHFTKDDLGQFNKLKDYIGSDIRLFIPQQVKDEIRRNRETKLKDAFKRFEINDVQYPVFCRDYEEYKSFSEDFSNIKERYKAWKKKIDEDILKEKLPADITIKEFFELDGTIPCEKYIDAAYNRYRIGNPPGKDNKYGDAINWECLLEEVPNGEDLHFISADKDYMSALSDDEFNPFLREEWKEKKASKIIFYKNLVSFLSNHVKGIQLKTEQEKQKLIRQLSESGTFITTHGIIAMLNKHTDWTDAQIEELCTAAENNNQVGWILSDRDILNFYSNLLEKEKCEGLQDCATKRIMKKISSYSNFKEVYREPICEEDEDEHLEGAYNECPNCGRKINFENDGGNVFCSNCASEH